MAIQVRRGNEADFDPSKMLPGEWAVSLDTKYVRMCFSPGVCLRMATYEAFETDMVQIQTILAECKTIQEAVARIQTEINDTAVVVEDYAVLAQSYAVGGTGTRENEDSDNAKYYYQQTKQISQGINGIIPMGTVTFAELPTENIVKNAMYNVSDAFTSDGRFNDGGGVYYGPGNNVVHTAEDKWDVTASSAVTGIKGANEDTYRQGNVSLSAEDVGAAPAADVTANAANIAAINTKIAHHSMRTYYSANELDISSFVLADIINAMPAHSMLMCSPKDLIAANPNANIPDAYGTFHIFKHGIWNIAIEVWLPSGQLYVWWGNENGLDSIKLVNINDLDGAGNSISETYSKKGYKLLLDSTSSNELDDSILNYDEIVILAIYEETVLSHIIPTKLFKDGLVAYGNTCKFCESRFWSTSNYQTWQVHFNYETGFVAQLINNGENVDRANYRIIVFGR